MNKNAKIIVLIVCICLLVIGIICGVIMGLNKTNEATYITDKDYLYETAKEYLINQVKESSHDKDMPNFNSFVAYKGFGIQENSDKTEKYAYMWVLQENYYSFDNQIYTSTGSSIPYKFTFKDDKVIKYDIPEDGSQYTSSMKKLFPSDVYNKIISYDSSSRGELGKSIREQLRNYYPEYKETGDTTIISHLDTTTFSAIIERNDYENNQVYVKGFSDNTINYRGNFVLKIDENTVLKDNNENIKLSELKRGETIVITYTGAVEESDPAGIRKVISISKFYRDKLILMDANHLSSDFVYEFSDEDKEKMSELINKLNFENTTTNQAPTYTFKLNGDEYSIKMFGEILIEKNNNQEAKLSEENKKELNSLLMKYVQHQ